MKDSKPGKEKRNIGKLLHTRRRRTACLGIVLAAIVFAGVCVVNAAENYRYETLRIHSSSLNGNTIWGSTENYCYASLDNYAAFYSAGRNTNGGLPTSGSFQVGSVPYQLANGSSYYAYDGKDSIRLTNSSPSRTMYLDTYGAYEKIYVLGTAGGPGAGNYANFKVTLTYTDGTTDVTTYRLYDWYNTDRTSGVEKYNGVRRVLTSSGKYDGSTSGGPVLQSATIDANSQKLLKSVTFTLAGVNDSATALSGMSIYCGVYAVTGAVNGNAPAAPTITATSDIYGAGFTADWTAVSGATCYYLDVSESPTFDTFVGEYNNKKITGTTAHIENLRNGTTYYCRVRAANSYGSGLSSNVANVVTYVPNTAVINLTLDGEPWNDRMVSLQYGSVAYELTGTDGVYRNDTVANGTYTIWVDGENTGETMSFSYSGSNMDAGDTLVRDIAYDTLRITTRLNNNSNSKPGDIALRQNGSVKYTGTNTNGTVELIVKEGEENEYRIYVGNQDTGKTITAQPHSSVTIDYYELLFALVYDSAVSNANVTLCNAAGTIIDSLEYKESSGTTGYYSKIMQKDEKTTPVSYYIYVNGQNVHKSISAVDGNYEAQAEFYRATVGVMLDGAPALTLQVTMTNGTESYSLVRSGNVYVNEFTLKNTSGGSEASYAVKVDTTLHPEEFTINSNSNSIDLVYYTVKYMIPTASGWVPYCNQVVRDGLTALRPSDPDYGAVELKRWCTQEDCTTEYQFDNIIHGSVVLYGEFEKPGILINGYVKTDATGTLKSNGSYYRMPNLTISGYSEDAAMGSVVFETTGCDEIIFLDDSIYEKLTPGAAEGIVDLNEKGTVLMELKDTVTMAQLQEYLQEKVVVKPVAGVEHTMQITVYGE
ncbi:MAG: hypothetical protein ACI4AA_03820 [Lachnospiraceae bacterium]